MYLQLNRFSRGLNQRVKNRAFLIKNKLKFISAKCVGIIYCNVHVLTDGKLNCHKKSIIYTYKRVRLCSQNIFIVNTFYSN